jgi:hypothetical protein
MTIILYFIGFIVLITAIAVTASMLRLSSYNKKVRAYTDCHDHRVIANLHNNFLAIDNNTQELTYISNKIQFTFRPEQIADVKITEQEMPCGPDEAQTYTIRVVIILRNHQTRSIEIQCSYSAQPDNIIYIQGQAFAKAIEQAVTDLAKDI